METLRERFERYKENNKDEQWRREYSSSCRKMQAIQYGEYSLEPEYIRDLWCKGNVGISGIWQGLMPQAAYDNNKEELEGFTRDLIFSPTVETAQKVFDRMEEMKKHGKISFRAYAIVSRILSAAAPDKFTVVNGKTHKIRLVDYLNNTYGLNIPTEATSNPAIMDSNMRSAIVNVIGDTDPILTNTFIWALLDDRDRAIAKSREHDVVEDDDDATSDEDSVEMPDEKNVIYYGPPGTGKTYTLQKVLDKFFTTKNQKKTEEQWADELVIGVVRTTILAAVIADIGKSKVKDMMRHPLLAANVRLSVGKTISNTVYVTLAEHSIGDNVNRSRSLAPTIFFKDEDSNWDLIDDWEDECPDAVELLAAYKKGYKAEIIDNKRFTFITFHQSYGYEEFIEGIRPAVDEDEDSGEIKYELKKGIFWEICETARKDPENNYAIAIDEINRGNISKIFGELITLIEEDKREVLSAELLYSRKAFTVPKNLYILGAMNTADRSLALLDTALRRRFQFIDVRPEPKLLENIIIEGIQLSKLLIGLNNNIEQEFDKEHAIGHSYFMQLTKPTTSPLAMLEKVFKNKIIPLLEEYFFDDIQKVSKVLGDENKTNPDYKFYVEEGRIYRLNEAAFKLPEAYIGIYNV